MRRYRQKSLWIRIKDFFGFKSRLKRRPPEGYENCLTPEEVAQRWNVTTKTLSQWRWNSRGPEYLKIGREIWYEKDALKSFEKKRIKPHTSYKGN